MKKIFITIPIILMLICFCILLNTDFVSAGYEIEVSIPGGPTAGTEVSLPDYIKYLYIFGLSLIGIATLGVLVYGGFMYMLSDTVVSKDDAKKHIWAAISGLILGLCAFLILYTINPDLTSLTPPDMPKPLEPAGSSTFSPVPSPPAPPLTPTYTYTCGKPGDCSSPCKVEPASLCTNHGVSCGSVPGYYCCVCPVGGSP